MKNSLIQVAKRDLYLISSVFHLLIAAAVSASRQDRVPLFVFVRFNKLRYKLLHPCLKLLLIADEHILFLEEFESAVKQRKANAKVLLEFSRSNGVENLFVGNDRHIEFQYVAVFLKPIFPALKCIYLDEGLYSYLGRNSSNLFAEKVVDQFLKRLVYGSWFQAPSTIGASDYIDEVWLAYPQQACSLLKSKVVKELPLSGFNSTQFKAFIDCWGGKYNLASGLDEIDFILTITDEKNFSKFPNYHQTMTELVSLLVLEGKRVAVKYHPNANQQDLLSLETISEHVTILPSELPFEVLLPLLPNATLIAEFSSTLITSRLLTPTMPVWSLVHESQTVPVELANLCFALDIQQYSQAELIHKIRMI